MPGDVAEVAIRHAATDLAEAEDATACPYCAGHIREIRVATEDLAELSALSDHMDRHPGAAAIVRRVSASAESVGALSLISRVFRIVRGGR